MNPTSPAAFAEPRAETDEQALVRAARSDPAAFAQLYRQYATPVYRYTLARVGNCEEAQDLTSQTFLSALQAIRNFRGQSKFSTWLFGIAHNKCVDYFRQRRTVQVPLELAEMQPSTGLQLDDEVERRVQFQELARNARLLPVDQAEALSLRIFGGLSAAEVGQVMGRSEASVKMLVHRAVCQLHIRLEHWAEAEQ